ncbi:phage tail sheath C-terminal domain-containing protein [Mycolicibacterium sp. 624]|uniref:phage tail sheath C-terminal domain-containing protein n=1 Tax=Mycolicibacterium sp. 624 TaxID=3156314 RepID=UPI003399CF0D
MPIAPTYPGVYIQELPSQFRAITGVATSVAAFIDWFPRGPLNEAIQVNSWADVERTFGGLHTRSEASYALDQFFANGGSTAWVVRVSNAVTPDIAATIGVRSGNTGGAKVLTLTAREPGEQGNSIRAIIEPGSTTTTFNLVVREVLIAEGRQTVLREERYNELSKTAADANFVDTVLDNHGAMVSGVSQGTAAALPSPSGTMSGVVPGVATLPANHVMDVELIVAGGPDERELDLGADVFASIDDLAARLQGALRGAIPKGNFDPARVEFTQATVQITANGDRLQVLAGTGATTDVRFSFTGPLATPAALGLAPTANENIAAYQLGEGAARAQIAGIVGVDGDLPRVQDLVGQEAVNPATGMYALNLADTINLLCVPRISRFEKLAKPTENFVDAQFDAAVAAFTLYCQRRRAMLLLDTPDTAPSPTAIKSFMTKNSVVRDPNVALFYPRLTIGDPLRDYLDRSIGASGAIAGICARTDANRGVWKAPAGTEALVRGITRLETKLTDAENGILNPVGINCLRTFDLYGHVNWGGRTLVGVDAAPNQWKYIPVRRLALFLEETLYRSTLWVIHEPNDEPLWAQIRLSVGAFMNDLFQKGAFQGRTKQEAYFVHCDSTTTTPLDQERGIVNLTVGFAPLKPAEFLIISIQQIPPQVEV